MFEDFNSDRCVLLRSTMYYIDSFYKHMGTYLVYSRSVISSNQFSAADTHAHLDSKSKMTDANTFMQRYAEPL
jgi:hypothetical protein